jgi:alpha-tubulin suppressor-like RCC1 family protein
VAIEADAKYVAIGGTLQLRTTVKDVTGATRTNVTVTWSAVDGAIASVSNTGLVTGNAGGIGRIRAEVGTISDEASISVAKVFTPGTPLEVTTDANGFAHVYTPSFGGLHYKLRVKSGQTSGLAGAIVGYSEQDGKSAFAIDGPDATWAPSLLFGSPDSLTAAVPGAAPPAAARLSAALTVAAASLEAKIGKKADLALQQNPDTYHLDGIFFRLVDGPGSCVSYVDAGPILKARPDRDLAVAYIAAGATTTNSSRTATVLPRSVLAGGPLEVANKLRAVGVDKWGAAPGQTQADRIRLRTDFLDPAKVGAAFRRLWDLAIVTTNDPTCPAAVAQLAFSVQPASVNVNTVIAPAVKVALQTAGGATIAGATDQVTVSLGQNTVGAKLSGTLTRAAVDGIVTFDDLEIDLPGTYTLIVTAAGKTQTSAPFTVTQPATPLAIRPMNVGHYTGCAIQPVGDMWCWGYSAAGVNGDGGANHSRFAPSLVVGNHSWVAMSGGEFHSCGLTSGGEVYCWGAQGILGNGTATITATPVLVAGGHLFTSLAAGSNHTCAVATDGKAYCWGSNANSQIGDGAVGGSVRLSPSLVTGGLTFKEVTAGSLYSCGLTPAGAAYCWGNNQFGQLGDGTTTTRDAPTAVAGGLTFTTISAQFNTTCGLTAAGAAYCWGQNNVGQVGDNTTGTNRLVPTQVAGGLVFASLTVGADHGCGLLASKAAYCWGGNNSGQLGLGSTGGTHASPAVVSGGLQFRSLAASTLYTCGIATDNKAYCWGANNFGQLGNATNTPTSAPGLISGSLTF